MLRSPTFPIRFTSQGIWASAIELPDEMSGLFLRHPSVGTAILVNSSHPRGRKRFSYAHEYAHALLDRDRTIVVSSADTSSDMVERRADRRRSDLPAPAVTLHPPTHPTCLTPRGEAGTV